MAVRQKLNGQLGHLTEFHEDVLALVGMPSPCEDCGRWQVQMAEGPRKICHLEQSEKHSMGPTS